MHRAHRSIGLGVRGAAVRIDGLGQGGSSSVRVQSGLLVCAALELSLDVVNSHDPHW